MGDHRNLIKINNSFQVIGKNNIFAFGDVTASIEKQGGLLPMQVPILANNIISIINNNNNNKLKEYKFGSMKVMVLPIGPNDGISFLPFMTLGSFATKLIKSKGLFLNKTWKDFNQKNGAPKYNKNYLDNIKF